MDEHRALTKAHHSIEEIVISTKLSQLEKKQQQVIQSKISQLIA